MDTKVKQCIKCNQTKPLELFSKNKRIKCGYTGTCKACLNESVKKWNRENPERARASSKRYYESHREKVRMKNKKTRAFYNMVAEKYHEHGKPGQSYSEFLREYRKNAR